MADLSTRDRAWLEKHRNGTEVFVRLGHGDAYTRDCRAVERLTKAGVLVPDRHRDTGTHFAFELTTEWYRRLENF